MLNERVSYSERPESAVIERLPDATCRVLLRANVTEETVEGYTQYFADEAVMRCDGADCPTTEELAEDFETWFGYASAWEPPKVKSAYQLQADIDYIAAMCGLEV